ncbi:MULTISPECIES: hybrid sensor histidine kinase/response regulator [Fischerella]|uniref:histidine kinase n=1 Tax=Fischerella muscicola CCMEE 5323 TaxID=2019572 RepID=A0A2N6K5M0_FISMU|nr:MULTISPECIES: response regulator [Fischerella]MBD2433214.1 response regulator [Fischerella sp. FACHB-380]PLZ91917.1 hybrid sensor histidine kinase/response regulator [Fischerella muscicola CCMEE 5323]
MAIPPEIRDQAYQFFVEEASELLQVLEVGLLSLNQERSIAKVHDLMRTAHTLKGGAASVGLNVIATLAHRLENILKAFYDETLEIDTELETYLLQAYDCLRLPLMEQIKTGRFDPEAALVIAEPIFSQLEARCGDAPFNTDRYIPSSPDLGINLVTDIFTVDVAQGLERLAKVLAAPHQYQVAGELRAQAEVFAGFAELLNLPEFGAIANTALQALNTHPHRALEITLLALVDFERYRNAVLSGDRTQQTGASATLVALANSTTTTPLTSEKLTVAESLTEIEAAIADIIIMPQLEDTNPTASLETSVSISNDLLHLQTEDTEPTTAVEIPGVAQVEENEPDSGSAEIVAFQKQEFLKPQNQSHLIPQHQIDLSPKAVQSEIGSALQVSQSTERYQTIPPFYVHQTELPTNPSLTVRVDSERLESMNNLVGELVISREGLFLQNEQLLAALRNLRQRFARLQRQMNQLRQICDQTLMTPEGDRPQGKQRSNFPPNEVLQQSNLSQISEKDTATSGDRITTPDFDSLEIDRYGALHSHVQEILEEMVQLEEVTDDMDLFAKQSEQILVQQRHMLTNLRDDLLQARMLPLGEILNSFPRVLRDLSTTYRKPVILKLTGADVLVEKAILEKLYDPLLHLLRNAFDHGIEPPEVRRQHSKPEQGQIEICAYHKGNQTIIEVKDDGQGLNLERIRSRALELGYLSIQQLAVACATELYEFIFEPGFSTVSQVNQLSGRGIGLDVVRSQLQSIKGRITVKSVPKQGTSFTLYLPLTLTMARLMICSSGSTSIALRTDNVVEILAPEAAQIRQSGTQRFLLWEEKIIPLYQLADLLDYSCPLPETPPNRLWTSIFASESWELPVLLLRHEQQIVALQVAQLLTEQELVIKPFGTIITPPSYTYGCTILGDGSLIPVIDANSLLSFVQTQNRDAISDTSSLQITGETESASFRPSLPTSKQISAPVVLVVDDAVTLRRSLALSLKRSGFRVLHAQNGQEAIEKLQQNSSVQLVICDIEMPRMNGFEFLSYRRRNPQLSQIPVVMLTSRGNEKHYQLAMQLGATAYFTKPYLEQEFITAVNNILADAAYKRR